MDFAASALLVIVILVAAMLGMLEAGRRLSLRHMAAEPKAKEEGFGAVEGGVFGLLGLLVAFTFSGAAARYDTRRQLVVEEANDIGTAYLRLDLLPPQAQPPLRELFRSYTDARLEVYRKLPDFEASRSALQRSVRLQGEIWNGAVAACKEGAVPSAPLLLLPALNAMFDITNVRTMAARAHPPLVIYLLLFGLALAGALLAGYGVGGGRKRAWVHILAFAVMMAASLYVIVDLEFPRVGLIRLDRYDQVMVELRESLK